MSEQAKLQIVNEALVMVGEAPLDEVEGESASQRVASLHYQPITDEMQGSHPWGWNRQLVVLNRLTEAPPAAAGFNAAFTRPNLCFRIVVPYVSGLAIRDWTESGNQIWLDAEATEEVTLEHHTRVDEALWRPAFRQAVVLRLAGVFAVSLVEDAARANLLDQQASRQLAVARSVNAQERPTRGLIVTNLTGRRAR
jgi:hypothetical protein